MTKAARQLQRMRHIKHNRHAKLPHDRKRAHVDDEIVITKTGATFRQQQLLTTDLAGFVDDVARVLRREKLAFLDVNCLSGFRGRHDQVSLPREKRRDLKYINNFSDALDLRDFVHVRKYRNIELCPHALQDFETGVHAESAKALD